MPFSPVFPGAAPLPDPRECPPNARSRATGAFTALATFVALVALGTFFLPQLAFFVPLLQAQAGGSSLAQSSATFQGFSYPWSRAETGGGYTTSASAANLRSEASIFHMNAVLIPIIADMPVRSAAYIAWHPSDAHDIDTLPDSDYLKAIKDARAAGLMPILELEVRQQDSQLSGSSTTSQDVGFAWFDSASRGSFALNGNPLGVGITENTWFDNYTAFAVHFAQLSAREHLPYFVIGDSLSSVSYDTANTKKAGDPAGILNIPGENLGKCSGRRDCEWRQVAYAIRNASYSTIASHQVEQGGSYRGKLIYFANWGPVPHQARSQPEFEAISWWDVVDYVGVDAYFPLTTGEFDPPVSDVVAAWQGTNPQSKGTGQGDIESRLLAVASDAGRPVVFTAGYESATGDNQSPGNPVTTSPDPVEQVDDMNGLLDVFGQQTWWAGVFWSYDEPIAPRSKQPGWATSSNWAGDTLATSKEGGRFLAQYYQNHPLH